LAKLSDFAIVVHFKEKFAEFRAGALTKIVDSAIARLVLDNDFK
jgi:hypothetical protein